jgi:O-succinylbenzoic acid--CoA ligase
MLKEIDYINASDKERSAFESFLTSWNNEGDTITVHTSGSTGTPKVLVLKKSDMVHSASQTLNFLQIEKGGTALICLSMETIAGKMMAVRSIVGAMKTIVGTVSSNPLQNILVPIDLCAMVPLQLENILKKDPSSLKTIKHLLIGGAPVSNELEKMASDHNISFWHTYGMTETVSHVALRKAGKYRASTFKALPGITFSEDKGRLIIHYPLIGIESLQTNDLVELLSPTEFKYIGRADFVINSGGIKFHPEELENRISHLIKVPFFIGGIPDPTLGQKVVLFAETDSSLNVDLEQLKNVLPQYAFPKEILSVPSFVRTESGKINRVETMKRYC